MWQLLIEYIDSDTTIMVVMMAMMMAMMMTVIMTMLMVAMASSGDRDYHYSYCLENCHGQCYSSSSDSDSDRMKRHEEIYSEIYQDIHYYHNNSSSSSSMYSNIFHWPEWTCVDMCKYMCMHVVTNNRKQLGYPILKYYGHWPFIRYMGLEEPASVAFSMLNALPHVIFIILTLSRSSINKQIPSLSLWSYSPNYYMRPWLLFYPILALLSWTSAVVFHAKKTVLTSSIDYLTAFVFIFYAFWIALRRVWGRRANPYLVSLSFVILVMLCCYRVYMMITDRVSFDNHMKLSISLAICSVVIWNTWIFVLSKKEDDVINKTKYHRKWLCFWCQLLFCFASLLEIFDFPPYYGIFDAHSLWHASTVPLAFIWYHFWYRDSIESATPVKYKNT